MQYSGNLLSQNVGILSAYCADENQPFKLFFARHMFICLFNENKKCNEEKDHSYFVVLCMCAMWMLGRLFCYGFQCCDHITSVMCIKFSMLSKCVCVCV